MNIEQINSDISDLAYMRTVKDALHRMSILDMETAPLEVQEAYKRCCRDAGFLRAHFGFCVDAHNEIKE